MGLIQKLFALLLLLVGVVAGALFYWANEPLIEAGGKPIEFTVEGNGKKLSVKANSREELESAIKAAQDFLAA
jgi:hypothetical protein